MFWLIFWIVSLFIFLVFPTLCVEENRRRWIRRIRQCRWNVDRPAPEASSGEEFHYVLSRPQEDEIRESFLLDKLKNYTMEITEDNIERPRANSTLDLAEKSESEHEFSDTAAGDVEKGVSSSTTGKENPTSEQVVNDAGNATAEDTADHSDLDVVKTATLNENTEQTSSSEIDPEKGHTFVPIAKKDEPAKYDNIDSNPTGETDPAATTEDANVDEISDDGSSVGAMVEFIGIGGEEDGMISVPSAGECRHDVLPEGVSGSFRKEPNGCAVCLCPFEPLDKITWSSNPSCQHVFHDTCIKDWLMASGRKHLKRQRREQRRTGNLSYESDPVGKITGFPKLCPCCRQHFIVEEEEESVDEKETRDIGDTENVDAAEMGNDEAMRIAAS